MKARVPVRLSLRVVAEDLNLKLQRLINVTFIRNDGSTDPFIDHLRPTMHERGLEQCDLSLPSSAAFIFYKYYLSAGIDEFIECRRLEHPRASRSYDGSLFFHRVFTNPRR